MLAFLDQQTLFNAVNFSVGAYPDVWGLSNTTWPPKIGITDWDAVRAINSTVRFSQVGIFLCPSDGGPFERTGTNYRGNAGVGPEYGASAEFPDSGNGLCTEIGLITPARIPDGLSHTAAFSERIRGSGGSTVNPTRDSFCLLNLVLTADDLLLASRAAARASNPTIYFDHGRYWFWIGRERTLYNHAQTPNGSIPDGMYPVVLTARGMATARSFHPGGVNVLMGDGSTRFVSDTIAQAVWRGFGSRNGSELVD